MLANILFKKIFLLMALAAGFTIQTNNSPVAPAKEKKILVFAKTNGHTRTGE